MCVLSNGRTTNLLALKEEMVGYDRNDKTWKRIKAGLAPMM